MMCMPVFVMVMVMVIVIVIVIVIMPTMGAGGRTAPSTQQEP